MDCTAECKTQNKQNSKHYIQQKNEHYYSFNNQISVPDSLVNQLGTLNFHINSNSFQEKKRQKENRSKDKLNEKQLTTQRKQSEQIYEDFQQNNCEFVEKQARTSTRYKSLQKWKQQFSPNSSGSPKTNKISLLGSIQLQNNKKSSQQNKNTNSKSQSSSGVGNISRNFPPSFQETTISYKLKMMLPTLEVDRKISSQQQSPGKKNLQRKYRIQRPDQVYNQLQMQNEKQKKVKVDQIVKQNINNTKALLDKKNENVQQTVKSNNYIAIVQKKPLPQTNLPMIIEKKSNQKFQNIESTCLARLPSPSIYESIKQFYTNQYYHKYNYLLNQQQLLIDNCYHIKYKDITKIKMIYNQFNRPQIKITYTSFQYQQISSKISKEISKLIFEKNKNEVRHSFCISEQELKKSGQDLVVYLCQCYEAMYTIFSCIVVRKLFSLNKQKQKNMLKDKKKQNKNSHLSINLTQLTVNTNLINCNASRDNNTKNKQLITFDYPIQGVILKKSRHMKKWERRYVRIQNFYFRSFRIVGLSSKQKNQKKQNIQETSSVNNSMVNSKSGKLYQSSVSSSVTSNLGGNFNNLPVYLPVSQNQKIAPQCTFQIQNIKQLWTRFEIIDQKYLVIKIFKKNKFEKIQLAIPIINYCDILVKDNWLFALIALLKGEI